jgi:beta-mannosidase
MPGTFTSIKDLCMTTRVMDLCGDWQFKEYPVEARRMRDLETGGWMKTQVPSSIYTSLINAGKIDKKQINTHPEKYLHISDKPWIYKKQFDADRELLNSDKIMLVFDGLDTVTQIWLNEKMIGKTENMFIAHRFDVTELLKPKANVLTVKFNPAAEHADKLMNRYGKLSELAFGFESRAYIRKAQYQFGWDFCPPFPGCGIWRNVRIEGAKKARIEDIHIRTIDCNEKYADIKIDLKVEHITKTQMTCKFEIGNGQVKITQEIDVDSRHEKQSTVIRIEKPKLWWPNGYGKQHLYKLSVKLENNNDMIDTMTKQFAIRTVRIKRNKQKNGENFQFEINNRPIYIKGANWIPPSMFPSQTTADQYKSLLKKASQANINMLRVWGGGYYENETFYGICDRLGIMVWQDFMFACAYYPDRKWFIDKVTQEAEAVIRQLRNHPSLVIWCGNNEIDWQHSINKHGKGKKFYGREIYHNVLPRLLHELDPDRDYIPSTPFSCDNNNPNDPYSGTFHQWYVWSGYSTIRDYLCNTKKMPRFVSEFGMQSAPCIETVRTFCSKKNLCVGSEEFEKHNYQLDGTARIARYEAELFTGSKKLEEHCYLTQITQARGVKKYVEHLRANNNVNRGVMFWQYDDCAPGISWACMDYLGNAKALYYYARRFYNPILATPVGITEQFERTRQMPLKPQGVVIVNDSFKAITGMLNCILMDFKGNIIDKIVLPVASEVSGISGTFKLPAALSQPEHPEESILVLQLENRGKLLSENVLTYLPDKHLKLPKAQIISKVEAVSERKCKVQISSEKFIKDLQVISDPLCWAEDNFIDILPGRNYQIGLELPETANKKSIKLSFRSVNSILG